MYKKIQIIAEVKVKSPHGYVSKKSWDELFELANKIGDVISIHTDPRWGGSIEHIKKARKLTKKPILAKGIHATDEEIVKAIKAGADYVLVVGRIPAVYKQKCLIEPLTAKELAGVPENLKVVWNNRDLSHGGPKAESIDDARKFFDSWICQASNIRTVADIHPEAQAVLVGTHLHEFAQSLN